MQILSIEKVKPGDVLGKSLFNDRGDLLLASGYELTEDMISLIRERGIRYVHLMTEVSKELQPQEVISDTVRQMANKDMAKVFSDVESVDDFRNNSAEELRRKLEEEGKFKGALKMPAVRRIVTKILDEVLDNPGVMFSSLRMRSEKGQDYEHAIDTAILSILLGRAFRYDHNELRVLGIAAMLHDIGKVILGDIRWKKPIELNGDQKMLLREHPIYSKLVVADNSPDSFIEQAAVLQHHEQHDGNGYPQGLTGSGRPPAKARQNDTGNIHRFAEILAVANVYDNLTTGQYNGRVHTPEEAITSLVNGRAGVWNPHVVRALVRTVQCYPVGITVRIKENHSKRFVGYRGVVARENTDEQSKPAIIITHNTLGSEIVPRLVDFSDEKHMTLEVDL